MELKEQLDPNKIPRHVAIIMDGNGRWAHSRGMERVFGHQNGVEAVRQTVNAAVEIGVQYLTFFAFSTENWERPKVEIQALMELLVKAVKDETPELHRKEVKLMAIGDLKSLPKYCQKELQHAIDLTKNNTRLTLIIALSYSSRWEITHAVKLISEKVQAGTIKPEEVTQELFESHLQTAGIPDPDLLVRTSGEQRISNFLSYQLAYSELYFPCVLWPDFRKEHFFQAIREYQKRERRYGKVFHTQKC